MKHLSTIKRVLLMSLLALLVGVVIMSVWVFGYFPQQSIALQQQRLFTVAKGTGFNQLCRQLVNSEVIQRCGPLKWYSKFHPSLRLIKAGTYQLDTTMDHLQLLQLFHSGKEHQLGFTLIEGERLSQILAKLRAAQHLVQDLPTMEQLPKALDSEYGSLEGLLFPDTYYYSINSSAMDIVKRSYNAMRSHLQQQWQNRAVGLPYDSPYEALIMASIIEKETAKASERALIASVFVNRLNKKMRLQTDPTVIYGLGEAFDGDITRAHLRQKTPYNTYRINGLPPTPIAMPALAAIEAALHPLTTEYLYFVAKKDGSHQFSTNLKQHNAAVRRYQLGLSEQSSRP